MPDLADTLNERAGQAAAAPRARQLAAPAVRRCALCLAAATAAFAWPLAALAGFALRHDLYSHIPLIPAIAAYLLWSRRDALPRPGRPRALPGPLVAVVAAGAAMTIWQAQQPPGILPLAAATLAYVLCAAAVIAWFFGREFVSAAALPLGFLMFAVPLPAPILAAAETALQHGSAWVAATLLSGAGAPFFREGMLFHLPAITLELAPECSGIHSTLALLVTAVAAGALILQSPWRRLLLAALVLPLAVLRNGFRVFVIAELCVHGGPQMIDSPLHRHGGPLFFVLSLVPFALALALLARAERRPAA